jgi:hypothetical protein
MNLYVANCTQQVQDFNYRMLESTALRVQKIEIGGQIRVAGNLTTPEIDYIVEQHARYGLVAVDEIDRSKPFIGLCYSIDKIIPVGKIERALEHNTGVLTERGRQLRADAAVASAKIMEDSGPKLNALNFTIEEASKPGRDIEFQKQEVTVTRNEPDASPTPSRKARRAA